MSDDSAVERLSGASASSLISRRGVLAGCGALGVAAGASYWGGFGRPQGTDGLQVFGNPYIESTYRRLIEAYSATEPKEKIEFRLSPRENDNTLRELFLQNFMGARLPDVAFVNGNMVRALADRKIAQPIDHAFEKDGFAVSDISGRPFGVRFGVSVPVVVYNRRLLERAGLREVDLQNDWAGVIHVAQRIHDAVPNAIGGFIEHDDNGALTFLVLLASYGLAPLSADESRVAFRNDKGVEALDVLRGFGLAGQAAKDMSRRQARRTFQAGGIGVFVTMSSVLRSFGSARDPLPILVRPLPLETGAGRVPAAGPVGLVVARDRAKQKEAAEFLRFAASGGQAILTETSGYLAANSRYIRSKSASLSLVDPGKMIDWYSFPGPNSSKIANYLKDILQQVVTLQVTPQQAVESAASYVERVLFA